MRGRGSQMKGSRALARERATKGPSGQVAQLVEHTTENRGVDSSILSLATGRKLKDSAPQV